MNQIISMFGWIDEKKGKEEKNLKFELKKKLTEKKKLNFCIYRNNFYFYFLFKQIEENVLLIIFFFFIFFPLTFSLIKGTIQ